MSESWYLYSDGEVTTVLDRGKQLAIRVFCPRSRVTVESAASLGGIGRLRSLSLSATEFPTSILAIKDVEILSEGYHQLDLRVHGSYLDDKDLSFLEYLRDIEELDLRGVPISEARVTSILQGFIQLEKLHVGENPRPGTYALPPGSISNGIVKCAGKHGLKALSARGLKLDDVCLFGAPLDSFEALDLGNNFITDRGVAELERAKSLKTLALDGCRLSDLGTKSLGTIHGLQSLRIGHTTIETLRQLNQLRQLKHLDIRGTRIGDAAIPDLVNLASLRTLDLSETHITEEGVVELAKAIPKVSHLCISGACYGPKVGSALRRLSAMSQLEITTTDGWILEDPIPGLCRLSVRSLQIERGIAEEGLENLRELSLGSVTTKGLAAIFELPALERLFVNDSTEAFERLSENHLPYLREIGAIVTNDGLQRIAKKEGIEALYISNSDISDSGFRILSGCQYIHTIELRDCLRISDASISTILQLERLHCIDLNGTTITSQGVACVAVAKNLQSIALDPNQITEVSVYALGKAPGLVELYLYGEPTLETFDMVAEINGLITLRVKDHPVQHSMLDAIVRMPKLRRISLIADSGVVDSLKERRPDLDIELLASALFQAGVKEGAGNVTSSRI